VTKLPLSEDRKHEEKAENFNPGSPHHFYGTIQVPETAFGIDEHGDGKFRKLYLRSDPRLKDNVQRYTGEAAVIGTTPIANQTEIKVWQWDYKGEKCIGFNAFEVQEVLPEAVKTDKDGYLMIDFAALLAYNCHMLKQIRDEVADNSINIEQNSRRIRDLEKLLSRRSEVDSAVTNENHNEQGSATAALKKTMRDYQSRSLEEFKKKDTILVMPTGTGKTLVAIKAIDHVRTISKGKVLFLVPTRALAEQQSRIVLEECEDNLTVATLVGQVQESLLDPVETEDAAKTRKSSCF